MSFRLVPKSVTFNDLERRMSRNHRVISPNSVAFGEDYVKLVEVTQYFLQRKCRPQNVVFSDVSFMAILPGVTPSESDKVRHSCLLYTSPSPRD